MRRLTVVNVAYPLARVGPNSVGGAEQILTAIDAALVKAGHRSIVVAIEGSETCGELCSFPSPAASCTFDDRAMSEQRVRAGHALREVLRQVPVDIVHMHGIDFYDYLPDLGPPVLATLHLPVAWYPADALAPKRPLTWFNCVSAHQAASAGSRPAMLPPICNGVPAAELEPLLPRERSYALMLARICPEKGQHLGLQAARAADQSLLIGGEVFPYVAHREYFAEQVEPLLDDRRRYIGPLGVARKRRLLANASCLLIPSLAAETSSLVAMEAASVGTPVIGFDIGALPEVIEHGRTGFIVNDVESMVNAMQQAAAIDPQVCQTVARERFAVERMTQAYIERYDLLARSVEIRAA